MNPDNLSAQWAHASQVPPFDPLGLPAPAWVILALAYLTFTIHLLAVNFTLGSVALALWARVRGKPELAGAGRFLGSAAPLGFSYLVTFGIPPLLFLQVVYGQFFYSSSVLIGSFWIMVIPLLITAYGSLYAHKLTRGTRPRPQAWLLGIALLAMLAIGFIYVNNLTLSMTPGRWLQHYTGHPGGGALNLGEPTVLPRFLLFLAPALFVAGLGLVIRGSVLVKRGEEAEGRASHSLGIRAALFGTILVAGGAIAVIATLPSDIRSMVTGGNMTAPSIAAAVFGLAALGLAWFASRAGVWASIAAAVAAALGMACLVVVRDHVRRGYLAPDFDLAAVPVNPQWGMFVIFAASLAVGLVFLIVATVMVSRNIAANGR